MKQSHGRKNIKLLRFKNKDSNATYPKHLPLEFVVGDVLVSINPCGRYTIVAPLPQIAKLSKNSQNNNSRFVS